MVAKKSKAGWGLLLVVYLILVLVSSMSGFGFGAFFVALVGLPLWYGVYMLIRAMQKITKSR